MPYLSVQVNVENFKRLAKSGGWDINFCLRVLNIDSRLEIQVGQEVLFIFIVLRSQKCLLSGDMC